MGCLRLPNALHASKFPFLLFQSVLSPVTTHVCMCIFIYTYRYTNIVLDIGPLMYLFGCTWPRVLHGTAISEQPERMHIAVRRKVAYGQPSSPARLSLVLPLPLQTPEANSFIAWFKLPRPHSPLEPRMTSTVLFSTLFSSHPGSLAKRKTFVEPCHAEQSSRQKMLATCIRWAHNT